MRASKILVSCVGTRGDVQPAVALAIQARALGEQVRLALPPNFVEWAQGLGFETAPVGIAMRPPEPGAPPPPIPDLIADQFDSLLAASEDCGLIVGAGAHQYAARSIADLRGIPCVSAVYAPTSLPSAILLPAGFPGAPQDADARALWTDYRKSWNDRSLARVNANRERLNLPVVTDVVGHILGERPWLAADPVLGPAPADAESVQTGVWTMPDVRLLPRDLEAFIDAGEPPVYLGFGSMPATDGAGAMLVQAARAVGRRVILSRGWGGLDAAGDADVILIDDVCHQALFPRVAAVVHHGGAGTTTTAAIAGAPQVVTPMFSDQFYWARRVTELGVGATTPAQGLDADALADALARALEPAVVQRAEALAPRVATDGAATAAKRLMEDFA